MPADRYHGIGMIEASAIAAILVIRSRLYQTGVKPWTLAPWARTLSVSASLLDARNATFALHRVDVCAQHLAGSRHHGGHFSAPFLGHVPRAQ